MNTQDLRELATRLAAKYAQVEFINDEGLKGYEDFMLELRDYERRFVELLRENSNVEEHIITLTVDIRDQSESHANVAAFFTNDDIADLLTSTFGWDDDEVSNVKVTSAS